MARERLQTYIVVSFNLRFQLPRSNCCCMERWDLCSDSEKRRCSVPLNPLAVLGSAPWGVRCKATRRVREASSRQAGRPPKILKWVRIFCGSYLRMEPRLVRAIPYSERLSISGWLTAPVHGSVQMANFWAFLSRILRGENYERVESRYYERSPPKLRSHCRNL